MSWINVDDKHKKKYDRNFVSCEEQYEREYVINTILEEFTYFKRESVTRAVEHCCRTMSAPRERKAFLDCVKNHIGKV